MFPQFDPSKMDPKVLMELTQLIRQLPPEKIARMQTLMHNMMAGIDVRREMEEFERELPPGFREKLMSMSGAMGSMPGFGATPSGFGATTSGGTFAPEVVQSHPTSAEMNMREARITILRAVAEGRMSPEEAEKLL